MAQLFLLGDPLLVHEFAAASLAAGHDVYTPQRYASLPGVRSAASAGEKEFTLAVELTLDDTAEKRENLQVFAREAPHTTIILTNALAVTIGEQSTWTQRTERLVGIGMMPTFLDQPALECTAPPSFDVLACDAVHDFFRTLGKQIFFVHDAPGMVLPRIRCMLANEACFALGENLASAEDIDTAMKLGTRYPSGPIEWMEKVGPAYVLRVMESLHRTLGEERYRPAPFLRRVVLAGSVAAALGTTGR